MSKVLVIGSEGMLGKDLMQVLAKEQIDTEGADLLSKDNCIDITDPESVNRLLMRVKPEVVINTAAYTDVDGCEKERDKAHKVNGIGVGIVAQACKDIGSFLIHISTDYVFDGKKDAPYVEEDETSTCNEYGVSKRNGERFIEEILDSYLIIRTSWLFGKNGKNFVNSIIDKAQTQERLRVVDDQCGSPTYTVDLAKAIAELLTNSEKLRAVSLLHITNSGSCTWFEFAKEILKVKGADGIEVEPITSKELDLPAARPKVSILDNARAEALLGQRMPSWQDALKRHIEHCHCEER